MTLPRLFQSPLQSSCRETIDRIGHIVKDSTVESEILGGFRYCRLLLERSTMSERRTFPIVIALAILLCGFSGKSTAEQIRSTRELDKTKTEIKHDKPGVRNENVRKESKYDKKLKKLDRKAPIGRPELKPEFARPDRAPGPPLRDNSNGDDKKK